MGDAVALNEDLTAIQREHGWTDAEMASEIGITRGGWSHIRLGRRGIGRVALRRILHRFPDLGHTTLFSLVSGVTETDGCVTMPAHDSDRLAG